MKRLRTFAIAALILLASSARDYSQSIKKPALPPRPAPIQTGVQVPPGTFPVDPAAEEEKRQEKERREKVTRLVQAVFATQDLREREKLYKEILQLDPYHAVAAQGLIETQAKLREQNSSTEQKLESLKKKEEAIERARRAYLEGDLEAAQSSLDAALALDPDDPEAKALLARIQSDLQTRRAKLIALIVVAALVVAGFAVFLFLRLRRRDGLLEMIEGPEPGAQFPLVQETTTFGSLESEVDYAIYDPSRRISRRHCSVVRTGKHYFLSDHSTNGTLVNGHPIPKGQPVLLHRGDRIALADDVILRLRRR